VVRQGARGVGEVDVTDEARQTLGVGGLEGFQPHEPAEHGERHDTFKRGMLSVCPHDCPSCCSLLVSVEDGRLTDVTGNPDHPFTQGVICGKVREYAERVHSPLRVLTPLRRVGAKGEGRFERISWDDAVAEIARRWRGIIADHGGEAILPFSYAGSMGQVQFYAGH